MPVLQMAQPPTAQEFSIFSRFLLEPWIIEAVRWIIPDLFIWE
ncbi:hypothetical protein PL9214650417 [Planktothrix tepida PCC 9214]|uniref:Uncharacterized protein n=1 Tax=Planktothrix tepida PCC 9214 TaxID=671072 RepID=A0A1J1LSJ6_9CYAN|nr:hypothetical protein PL9214650417 [Planktothrix tepida PCC 9214]